MGANEVPVSQHAIYVARPTIEVDGQSLERVTLGLLALDMTESVDGLAALELRLSNWVSTSQGNAELAFDAGSPLWLGSQLRVHAGALDEQALIFEGQVSALTFEAGLGRPPAMHVHAEDKLMLARLARRTRVYEELSLAELAQRIGAALGLTVNTQDLPDVAASWAQFNESDLAFLRRVLRRYDCAVRIAQGQMQVAQQVAAGGDEIELALYSQLRQVQVVADLAHQCTAVTASGFDPVQGAPFSVEATGRHGGAGQGSRGDAVFSRVYGGRPEHLAPLACSNEREAQALAEAAFDQRVRRFVTVRGTAEGNVRLRAGGRVRLTGLGARFDNTYDLAACTHRFDLSTGYQTDFVAHSAFMAED